MKKAMITLCGAGLGLFAATAASAQTMPMGEELYNQTVQVRFSDGTVNTVYFEEDGDAIIRGPGVDPINADWRVANNQLCLIADGDTECWAYTNRFQAGTPVTLVSTCDVASQWVASAVNPVAAPAPAPQPQVQPVERSGERG